MNTTMKGGGLSARTLATLRARLEAARHAAIVELGVTDDDLAAIAAAPESELEERAQEEAAADVLRRVGEHEYRRLREIQEAIDRIATGAFGKCAHCGNSISTARLRAIPTATACVRCATAAESARTASEPEGSEPGPPVPVVPPELSGLSDAELAQFVRERFHDEVGDALDSLRVLCRHAVITLAGETSSKELRDTARRLVEEEIGLEIVDRMKVSRFATDRPRRPDDVVEGAFAGGEQAEDIFDVEEEGLGYTPPARPPAQRE